METLKKNSGPVMAENPAAVYLGELKSMGRRLLRNKGATLGGIILLFFIAAALAAPLLSPHDPGVINALAKLRPPSSTHYFGTDGLGRDIFSRVLFGARLSLQVGGMVIVTSTLLGILFGLAAGYYRKLDNIIMRVLDGFMAFPSIILNIGIMAALGPSIRNVVIALTFSYSPRMARIVRGAVLVQKEQQYVEAARVLGAGDFRILMHILPNCMAPIIVQATMIFAYAILAEASLSFLGVGVPPEIPSWGNILAQGRNFIRRAPWITLYSGIIISAAVLSVNQFGDGLRDILDPKLRR
jgi:peptide/nickel transport system permease protein